MLLGGIQVIKIMLLNSSISWTSVDFVDSKAIQFSSNTLRSFVLLLKDIVFVFGFCFLEKKWLIAIIVLAS